MIITRQPESAHWYLKDGSPFYEVLKADGSGMRPANIRDAFKAGAYRSVTNVLGVVAKPGLVKWQVEQAVLSALTLPRRPGETEQEFAARAIVDSEEQKKRAAQRGTELHNLAEIYLNSGNLPKAPIDRQLMQPFFDWVDENVRCVCAAEMVVLNHQNHYAGRLDMALELKDGTFAICDIKTQDVGINAKGDPKPEFYEEWAMQLAAYSKCPIMLPEPDKWRLLSLVIGRNTPGMFVEEWTENADKHFAAFVAACGLWSHLKGGTPGFDAKKAA